MNVKHKCFYCGEEVVINPQINNGCYNVFSSEEGTITPEATFIDKNKIEVVYKCNSCRNNNKLIIDLQEYE